MNFDFNFIYNLIDYAYSTHVEDKHIVLTTNLDLQLVETSLMKRIKKNMNVIKIINNLIHDLDNIYKIKKLRYPGIMCRYHLKVIKKKFKLDYENILDLYYDLAECIILDYEDCHKLLPIKHIKNKDIENILSVLATRKRLNCDQCKMQFDICEDDKNKYIRFDIKHGIIQCFECEQLLCESCYENHYDIKNI